MEKENTQSCKRYNETYVVVSTYYKHGEYDLNIFYSEKEIRDYLIKQYMYYDLCDKYCEDPCVCQDDGTMDILTLIKKVCKAGNKMIDYQHGWGVREVRKI